LWLYPTEVKKDARLFAGMIVNQFCETSREQ